MKKNTVLVTSVALLAFVATSAFALAQQDDSAWIEQRVAKRIVSRIEGKLNLTVQQREQAKSILKNEEPTILALAGQAKQERAQLAAMQSFDGGQVREIAQQYATTNTDILVERTKVRLEVRAILNDAQRQQLDQMRARVGAHLSDRIDTLIDAI
jgi:Spy/CpxP family protein refolding chaperone